MDEKVDRLFLEKDCPMCGVVRAELDMVAATSQEFKGKDGQSLRVFAAMSRAAAAEMMERFGLGGKLTPVLVTWEGDERSDIQQILSWMRKHGMSTR